MAREKDPEEQALAEGDALRRLLGDSLPDQAASLFDDMHGIGNATEMDDSRTSGMSASTHQRQARLRCDKIAAGGVVVSRAPAPICR